MPSLEDLGLAVVALDQQAALVVGGEVHRADHPVPAPLGEPGMRGREQRPATSGSFSASKNPNRPHSLPWNSLKVRSMWAQIRPTG